jgi:hypothetical protein
MPIQLGFMLTQLGNMSLIETSKTKFCVNKKRQLGGLYFVL